MKSSTSFRFSSLLFFFIVASRTVYSEDEDWSCSYKLIVQTGDRPDAGTNSRISVTLGNSAGDEIEIPDLKKWGTMWYGHDYFEKGKRDFFSPITSCFSTSGPVCNITVTSDGSGQKPGWFLGAVEVSEEFTSLPYTVKFNFGRWFAKDEPPYKLTASVNKCR